jgi:hypothetical protein
MNSFGVETQPPFIPRERASPLAGEKDESGSRQQAWQREMERAQADSWLSHSFIGHAAPPAAGSKPSSASASALNAPGEGGAAFTAAVEPKPSQAGDGPGDEAAMALPQAIENASAPAGVSARGVNPEIGLKASELIEGMRVDQVLPDRDAYCAESAPAPSLSEIPDVTRASGGAPAAKLFEESAFNYSALQIQPADWHGGTSSDAEGSEPVPREFNAASLSAALQPFDVQATVAPATNPVPPEAPKLGVANELRGLSRAAEALGVAASKAAEPPRGLLNASSVIAGLLAREPKEHDEYGAGAAQRATQPQFPKSAAEPIRVHADWSEQGVRLWLGMDAAALDSLDQITLQLQAWLAAQGLRLRSMACNGRFLVPDASGPGASPVSEPESLPTVLPPSPTTEELS